MKPPRTAYQLQQKLDKDFAWRLQEIASIRKSIHSASGRNQVALLRAAVPLLYAHWEGFIKTASFGYAGYISSIGIQFSQAKKKPRGFKSADIRETTPPNNQAYLCSFRIAGRA
jgi:hypothetical protein